MNSVQKNLLITGLPGVGKTTLIKNLSDELEDSTRLVFTPPK